MSELTLELDDLKRAWRSLDARLQRANALDLQRLRERSSDRTRRHLRPLFWGQVVQVLYGVPFIALAALLWSTQPAPASAVVAGIAVQVYGVLAIMSAGVVIAQLQRLDYAAPVLELQAQLLRARTLYVRWGLLAGLPWWFLWVLLLMVFAGLGDIDLLARAPSLVWGGLAGGVIGLLATWGVHRWARRPGRAGFARQLDDSLTGGSLRRALAEVEAFQRVERE